jgi:hypothetical protein
MHIDDETAPIWGAEAIGRAAGVFDKNDNVDVRKAFYLLEEGFLPATKVGRRWTSTRRRLRRFFAGEPDERGWQPNAPGTKSKTRKALPTRGAA